MGKCSQCGKRTKVSVIQIAFGGNRIDVKVCSKCGRSVKKMQTYASAFPAKASVRGRPKKQAADPRFDKYALKPEEIAETQRLRPAIVKRDTPLKRELDRVDVRRVRVYDMGIGSEKRIMAKAMKMLGTSDVRIVSRSPDGFENLVEAVN